MPTLPGLNANAAQQSSPAESPATTEIQLLTSRTVLSEALDNLDLDVQVQPARFPLFGSYIARHYAPSHPNAVNEPWFGMARYGWGGESVQISMQLPRAISHVFQGLLLMLLLGCDVLVNYRVEWITAKPAIA